MLGPSLVRIKKKIEYPPPPPPLIGKVYVFSLLPRGTHALTKHTVLQHSTENDSNSFAVENVNTIDERRSKIVKTEFSIAICRPAIENTVSSNF